MPGDSIDSNTFALPSHERDNLSDDQCAEHIAEHFASISREFPPLDVSTMPDRVQTILLSPVNPPVVSDHEVYEKIRVAKKHKSGVPNDLPKIITQEFSPELARPVGRIINTITRTGSGQNNGNFNILFLLGKYQVGRRPPAIANLIL